jgi:hypothetical protein
VPELSRFYGIVIRMFDERGARHHRPHFHAAYGGHEAVFSIDTLDLIRGTLSRPQGRLVEAWGELRRAELVEDWRRLRAGERVRRIAPLR